MLFLLYIGSGAIILKPKLEKLRWLITYISHRKTSSNYEEPDDDIEGVEEIDGQYSNEGEYCDA